MFSKDLDNKDEFIYIVENFGKYIQCMNLSFLLVYKFEL